MVVLSLCEQGRGSRAFELQGFSRRSKLQNLSGVFGGLGGGGGSGWGSICGLRLLGVVRL